MAGRGGSRAGGAAAAAAAEDAATAGALPREPLSLFGLLHSTAAQLTPVELRIAASGDLSFHADGQVLCREGQPQFQIGWPYLIEGKVAVERPRPKRFRQLGGGTDSELRAPTFTSFFCVRGGAQQRCDPTLLRTAHSGWAPDIEDASVRRATLQACLDFMALDVFGQWTWSSTLQLPSGDFVGVLVVQGSRRGAARGRCGVQRAVCARSLCTCSDGDRRS